MGEARLCVLCREREVDVRFRPFCSERCRHQDLARWADGHYRIAAERVVPPDEEDSSEP